MTQIKRTKHTRGTKQDLERVLSGMVPISGIEGVNVDIDTWWIHPDTCSIVHIIRVENREPLETIFVWMEIEYDPTSTTGYSTSGHKTVKVNGKAVPLHRVVALSCVPNDNPQDKTLVKFKNGNKRDIRAENLIWVSPKEAQKQTDNPKKKIKIKLNLKNTMKGGCNDGAANH